jgi:uncharacterized protein YndB with AHSA1/START domain
MVDNDKVVVETTIAVPPVRVFQALTDEKQLFQWWTNEEAPIEFFELQPRLGGHYRYICRPGTMKVPGLDKFECHGEITEFDPPRTLAYTWISNWHDDPNLVTLVRFELIPEGNGTRLKVTHSGLAKEQRSRKEYAGGWVGVLELLKNFVERK